MDIDAKSGSGSQFVVFSLGQQEYGVDIQKVSIIEKLLNIARVPRTQDFILGVINLRGEIIPVLDLRLRFGMPSHEADDDSRIIIFRAGEVALGILVDRVSEVTQLKNAEIESITSITDDRSLDYISGVGKLDGRLITLLHVEKLIADLGT